MKPLACKPITTMGWLCIRYLIHRIFEYAIRTQSEHAYLKQVGSDSCNMRMICPMACLPSLQDLILGDGQHTTSTMTSQDYKLVTLRGVRASPFIQFLKFHAWFHDMLALHVQ